MFQTLFNRGSLPIAEQWLYFTRQRHDAIANNIANAETPEYKALDSPVKDFQTAMARALKERDRMRVPVFQFEGYGGIEPLGANGLKTHFEEDRHAGILKHSENNVDLEIEMGKLVKNSLRHGTVAQIVAHEFSMLRTAISEKIS